MDNEQARFLLGACRPSGAESSRPEIASALERARIDPELAAWLAQERRSDEAIMRKMRQLEPPEDLRARLLAGGRASRRTRQRRRWLPRLALAASLALACGLTYAWLRTRHSDDGIVATSPAHLLDWQKASVGIFSNPLFSLDLEGKTYPPLETHLRSSGARVAGELPFSDAIVEAVGCKILNWRGHVVSLTCFHADSGELVHLFVIPRGALDETELAHGPHRAQVGAYATVTWLRDDRVVMVASKLPATKLERTLAPDARLAARSDAPAIRVASMRRD